MKAGAEITQDLPMDDVDFQFRVLATLSSIKDDILSIQADVGELKGRIARIELLIENLTKQKFSASPQTNR